MGEARYDTIGHGYARTRREDPALVARIEAALGDATTVLNVGAGTGSYESAGRRVVAVEPSAVMVAQRGPGSAPVARGVAAPLPVRTDSVDAAMAVVTIHHWDGAVAAGLGELRRAARGPVMVVTYDADVCGEMWLPRDYLPEAAALDRATFPAIDDIVAALGGRVDVEAVPTSRHTPDWTFASFWAHPERVLDAAARASTSAFARADDAVVARTVAAVERDLADGTWERRHGHLRTLDELDVGMRLVVAHP